MVCRRFGEIDWRELGVVAPVGGASESSTGKVGMVGCSTVTEPTAKKVSFYSPAWNLCVKVVFRSQIYSKLKIDRLRSFSVVGKQGGVVVVQEQAKGKFWSRIVA